MNAALLVLVVREFFTRYPEYRFHQPWELQWLLFALGYVQDLADEDDIAMAAGWVRRTWYFEAA